MAAGMDGAERIDAGSAITWTQTMGYVAAVKTVERLKDLDWLKVDEGRVKEEHERLHTHFQIKEGIRGWKIKREIQNIMWECCGLVREGKELEEGLKRLERVKGEDLPRLSVSSPSKVFNKDWVESQEAINMAELAEISLKAALMRKESRGSRFPGTKCAVLWGTNPNSSSHAAQFGVINAKRQGAKIIVVDPRRIPLAKKADIHPYWPSPS